MANLAIPRYVKVWMWILALFMPVILILPFFLWPPGADSEGNVLDAKTLQEGRLAPVGRLNVVEPGTETASAEPAAAFDPQQTYDTVCSVCHKTGISNAPIYGDHDAWQAKIDERGSIDALTQQAITGINAMPPKGGAQISDEDFKTMVHFMLNAADIK